VSPRTHDLLQTTVILLMWLTPAWLLPAPWGWVWGGIVALAVAPSLWRTWWHAPWVPSPPELTEPLIAELHRGPCEVFVDLGAGDGRVLQRVHAATGAHCEGVEAVPWVWLLGQLRLARSPCRLHLGDLYRAEVAHADVVFLWGTAYGLTPALSRHLAAQLRPGARVLAYGTPLPDWPVARRIDAGQRALYVHLREDA
jgi:hypothetical protein